MVQSGRHDIARGKLTTRRPLSSSQTPTPETSALAAEVPIAAPRVPNAGIGPVAGNQHHVERDVEHRQRDARAAAACARRPPPASAPPSMKNISIPMLNTNIVRRNGSASARTAGVACTSSSR